MASRLQVTVSYAQSIDGRIATASGDSRWISGPATLRLAQRLRATHEVILVGIGTVLRDDPELTCRLRRRPSPVRVILDTHLRLPLDCTIVRTARQVPVIAATSQAGALAQGGEKRRRLEEAGVRVAELALDDCGRVSAAEVVSFLASQGHRSLFIEGGGEVITSFLRAGLVSRLLVVTAPLVIGAGVQAVGDLGVWSLAQALRPERVRARRRGADLVWELEFHGA
ncbi:MAG: RibD family protein [Spirochaetales bacterium]|nr:RibD family protein [Spirochaetales bacterium]